MSEDKLKSLKISRGSVKGQITRLINNINDKQSSTIEALEMRKNKLQDLEESFLKIQAEIEDIDNISDHSVERALFETQYYDCFDIISFKMSELSRNSPANSSVHSVAHNIPETITVKQITPIFGQIEIKPFDGNPREWKSFYDTFKTSIHECNDYLPVQKFNILKQLLKGKITSIINHLNATEENYDVAWALLQKRCNKPRQILQTHLKSLFELPTLDKESPMKLNNLIDQAEININALKALDEPVDKWDSFLVFLISMKLDSVTRRAWERTLEDEDKPKFSKFLEFLQKRARSDEFEEVTESKNDSENKRKNIHKSNHKNHAHVANIDNACAICSENHVIYKCDTFSKMPPSDRFEKAKNLRLCINCLKDNHNTMKCKILTRCKTCRGKHHSLLHFNNDKISKNTDNSNSENSNNQLVGKANSNNSVTALSAVSNSEILLGTAVLKILDKYNNEVLCRVLIDTGSQSNFITEKLAEKLMLPKQKIFLPFYGIGGASTKSDYLINAKIKSRINDFETKIDLVVLPKITSRLPSIKVDKTCIHIPSNFILADPEFNVSKDIDGLIGNVLAYRLLSVGQYEVPNTKVLLQKTRLGWLVTGEVKLNTRNNIAIACPAMSALEKQIDKFWEIEEVPSDKHLSPEEKLCEQHYKLNTIREESGSYVVKLPFKENIQKIGSSYDTALKRFYSLENKLSRNPEFKMRYVKYLKEYEQMGHMINITSEDNKNSGCYLPHHGVIKESSETTKLRVVFDASAKTSTGLSLNDTLMTGPKLQNDLFTIVLKFRKHNIVFTADIEKMFRIIKVDKNDANYQKIIWREDSNKNIEIFKLTTVTFGQTCASFLSSRNLIQLAEDERVNFPEAASILENDFYIDDLISGADSVKKAMYLKAQLIELLKKGGFNLRQWMSNEKSLRDFKQESSESKDLIFDTEKASKVLGIKWHPVPDKIKYSVHFPVLNIKTTKRTILSEIAQIFDPLGLLGPVITAAKLIMQSLWKEKDLGWDQTVPQYIYTQWHEYKRELIELNKFEVDRKLLIEKAKKIQLHGFCDASEKAYGACIYVRSTDKNNINRVQLLCSKSRVAPLKTKLTVPKLELCATLLLAKLQNVSSTSLDIKFEKTILWSDAEIALHWIKKPPHILKTFVANRVSEVRQLTETSSWYHVSTEENPADALSRGENALKFLTNKHWLTGPSWLQLDESEWKIKTLEEVEIPEQRIKVSLITQGPELPLFQEFSTLKSLIKFVSYCMRMINIKKYNLKLSGELSVQEIECALIKIIKLVQQKHFYLEIEYLKKGKEINKKSKVLTLSPFIDNDGLLRVGGRLKHAPLNYNQKHPILLPSHEYITTMLIQQIHVQNWHSGTQATLNLLRNKYWIVDGKNTVRNILHKCIRCRRLKPKIPNYIMANLPLNRFDVTRPFINVGIDYCGPFYIKEKKFRNRLKVKAYVVDFVCFATKAIHLELVTDLTADTCLEAIKRFMSRRGKPKNIYSDNAKNFVGAKNEIKFLEKMILSDEYNNKITNYLHYQEINWHFIPAYSPHHGGLWEAGVKSFKYHLYRTVGDSLFTYEEFNTYIIEIEGILNSRPLIPISSDPNDFIPLTPAHFLIGDSLATVPEHDLRGIPSNRLSQWQMIQRIKQHFWSRWKKEYLNELQVKNKWHSGAATEIAVDTLVVLKDDDLKPMHWQLGRIVKVHPGDDGVTRVADVKTADGIFRRGLKQLCPLMTNDEVNPKQ